MTVKMVIKIIKYIELAINKHIINKINEIILTLGEIPFKNLFNISI